MAAPGALYRPDIDGLRAIAVLSVVLYHAGVPVMPGGYIGVDIFFVISGYLITRIIAREIEDNRFSLLTFYERRTRRIFPALFAMLAASVVAASLIALPGEFEDFGNSLAAATLFVSNIFFWQTADYFAGPAHVQPLLHTWSLAVEEQFYIILPLLLLALHRWARRHLAAVLIVATLLSFALSVWAVGAKPAAAFYLLPTRFWELMAGALLALGVVPAIPSQKAANAAAALGLAMIAFAVGTYSSATAFPGAAALMPVIGAALIIHAGTTSQSTLAARMLSLKPVVFVGLISYSLYLWHWPVLTFARIARAEILSAMDAAVLVALSVALAILSWRYIETPFRERHIAAARAPLFSSAGAAMAAALAIGVFANVTHGWTQRHDGYAPPTIAGLDRMNLGTCFLKDDQPATAWAGASACRQGNANGPTVFVWGDSFAAHLIPGLAGELGSRIQTVQLTAAGCPPILDLSVANRPHCRAINARALEEIERLKPGVVLVSARWELYMPRKISHADVHATLDRVAATGARVIVLDHSPTFDFAHPYDVAYRTGRNVAFANPAPAAIAASGGITVFDPAPLFCSGRQCRLSDEHGFFFFDGGHYSVEGSRRVAHALAPVIDARPAPRPGIHTSQAR
ncbi:MAG: acyltransferase [Hyphomonas sp.]|nr:acyltransferase [Hyphomonas sp.]